MKKLIALLLALCLVFGLVACGGSDESSAPAAEAPAATEAATEAAQDDGLKVFVKDGFMITLPDYAEDNCVSDSAAEETFSFYVDDIYIYAIEVYKEDFSMEMTSEEFAQTLIDTNGYDSAVEIVDGMTRFEYPVVLEGDIPVVFISTTQVTESSYWVISAMVEEDKFESKKADAWTYISSTVTVATGDAVVMEEASDLIPIELEGLTVYVSPDYEDASAEAGDDFLFTYLVEGSTIALLGDEKTFFELSYEYSTAEEYAQAMIDTNYLSTTWEYRDDIVTYTYDSTDGDFTYMAIVLEDESALWLIQGYTFAEDFPALEDTIWDYLSRIQLN